MENKFKVGDTVYWGFVFDRPDFSGKVVAVYPEARRVKVEFQGYELGKGYGAIREWMDFDDVCSEAETDAIINGE